jgi:putative endonuclease
MDALTNTWYLYVVRCGDGSLYTGIATDVARRFREHQSGAAKCAKYLRGRGPLRLLFKKKVGDKGTALRLESRVKKLSKVQKETLLGRPKTFGLFMRQNVLARRKDTGGRAWG